MNSNAHSLVFAIFTLAAIGILINSLVHITRGIMELEQAGVNARLTYVTAAIAWAYVSLVAPVIHLCRMHRRRIRVAAMPWWRLFTLRWPWHTRSSKSVKRVLNLIDGALRRAEGEQVGWRYLDTLNEEEQGAVQRLVEERLGITADWEVEEESAWVLLFFNLLIASVISWAGRYAALEVISENLSEDHQVGRVLAEWLSNSILLFAGFLQLTSRGSWLQAIQGRCQGPLNTISGDERKALVAFYVVLARAEVKGLKRDGCYGKVWQNGRDWKAPRVSSSVLALLGEHFVVRKDGDGRYVDWDGNEESFEVRMIGSDDSCATRC